MNRKPGRRKWGPYVASVLGALLAIGAVVWALVVDHEVHLLRWKLHAGEVLRYRTTSRMGTKDKKTYHQVDQRFDVESVSPEGIVELRALAERTTIRDEGPEGRILWDSISGAPIPKDYGIAVVAAFHGVPIRYRIDSRGRILEEKGTDVVKTRMKDAFGGGFLDAITEASFSSRGGVFIGIPLPEAAVKKGSRWQSETSWGTREWGQGKSLLEYALEGVRRGVATITLVETKTKDQTEGEIPKAMNIKIPHDPDARHESKDSAEFLITEGILRSQEGEIWTQSRTAGGKIFRFETKTTTTLLDRTPAN